MPPRCKATRTRPRAANALETIRERLVELSEDVHALSYRLHPSVIEDLGLVAALRVECNRVARQEPIRVDFDARDVPAKVPVDTGICLFRVAQEALRNVVRHANASNVEVSLQAKDGGITLAVRDDGRGLGDSSADKRASLGLVSMRERVRLVGGKLDIVSRPIRARRWSRGCRCGRRRDASARICSPTITGSSPRGSRAFSPASSI